MGSISTRFIIAPLALVFLAGCSASGIRYTEHQAVQAPVHPSAARITVFRTKDSGQYSARSAPLNVDGRQLGNIQYGGFGVYDLLSGPHVLMTELSNLPGKCELPIALEPGDNRYFEIQPRLANFVAAVTGSVVGASLESAGKTCAGAFSIAPVNSDTALIKLRDLRKSN